jgi:hypothetical protein
MSEGMAEEGRYIPLDELDEDTRREVLKTRRFIKLVGLASIGLIVLMAVLTIVAVLIAYGD